MRFDQREGIWCWNSRIAAYTYVRFMKRARTFLLISITLTTSCRFAASGSDAKLPDDALRLKSAYQEASERAIQPLREHYIYELKRLLEQATRVGKLDDAVAIQHELTSLAPGGAFSPTNASALAQALENSSWNFTTDTGQPRKLTFKPGGSISFDDGFQSNWNAVDATHAKSREGTFTLSSDANQFELVRPNKKVWTGRRNRK